MLDSRAEPQPAIVSWIKTTYTGGADDAGWASSHPSSLRHFNRSHSRPEPPPAESQPNSGQSRGNAAHSLHSSCPHQAPMPTTARDQARYVRSGWPLVNRLEAYSAAPVVASDPVGSVDVVPVISLLLPAPMAAWLRH
jgi:hypothetical protein